MKTVVIGNGPSINDHLKAGDFDLLAEMQAAGLVETWAMNMIELIYPKTSWRPSAWVWVEFLAYGVKRGHHAEFTIEQYGKIASSQHVLPGVELCIIEERFKDYMKGDCSGVTWISRCADEGHNVQVDSSTKPDDWHLPVPCVYGGTMNTVMPLVFMAGQRDVAVIGCDLGIVEPDEEDHNHFDPQYMTYTVGDYILHDDTLRDVHRMAKKNFEDDGGNIVNCSIGGELEVYDRVSLREFLDV